MLDLKIYMSPKMLSIASEPSIEYAPDLSLSILTSHSPGGLEGPGGVATRLLQYPCAHRLVVFDGVYWQWLWVSTITHA